MLRNGYILHAGISNRKEVGERESTHLELRAPSFPSGVVKQERKILLCSKELRGRKRELKQGKERETFP